MRPLRRRRDELRSDRRRRSERRRPLLGVPVRPRRRVSLHRPEGREIAFGRRRRRRLLRREFRRRNGRQIGPVGCQVEPRVQRRTRLSSTDGESEPREAPRRRVRSSEGRTDPAAALREDDRSAVARVGRTPMRRGCGGSPAGNRRAEGRAPAGSSKDGRRFRSRLDDRAGGAKLVSFRFLVGREIDRKTGGRRRRLRIDRARRFLRRVSADLRCSESLFWRGLRQGSDSCDSTAQSPPIRRRNRLVVDPRWSNTDGDRGFRT
mmetsp:Transcript_1898/g.4971  ORF Transcript_1898/g.4971 Transcript_1898/m.4971 type:complete len:263 (+) Transcript_1898:628-1416(+)